MHRKKKIPVGFIVTFVAAFILAVSLTVLLAKFKPDMAQFMGMIFFGSCTPRRAFPGKALLPLWKVRLISMCLSSLSPLDSDSSAGVPSEQSSVISALTDSYNAFYRQNTRIFYHCNNSDKKSTQMRHAAPACRRERRENCQMSSGNLSYSIGSSAPLSLNARSLSRQVPQTPQAFSRPS